MRFFLDCHKIKQTGNRNMTPKVKQAAVSLYSFDRLDSHVTSKEKRVYLRDTLVRN